MKTESEKSPAIPYPPEQQPLPPNPVKSSESVSAVPPPPPQVTMEEIVNSNGIVSDTIIDETEQPFYFKYLDSEAYIEKCRRYESDFRKFLVDIYFSGGDIYEEMLEVENEVVMTSKWPCTRLYADREVSYIDPVQYLTGEYGQVQEVEEDEDEEEVKESVEAATAEITPGDILDKESSLM